MIKIGRVVPPAAAPLGWRDLWHGASGLLRPQHATTAVARELREHFAVRHVFLVSSGTAALSVTLAALHALRPKTNVVIPAYTCFSVPAAVVSAGLRPVPCDIDPTTFDYDAALLEAAIDDETLCVVAHHLFGIPSDVARLRDLCRARGVGLVEDAAQAMGGTADGQPLGTIGDAGIFSLGRGKNITCGAGGIAVTNSDAIAAEMTRLVGGLTPPTMFGSVAALARLAALTLFVRPSLYWIPAAIPALGLGQTVYPRAVPLRRLSGMQAGVLRRWRTRLAESNRARTQAAAELARQLGSAAPVRGPLPYLRLPVLAASRAERDRILAAAQRRGLGLSGAYPTAVDGITELRAMWAGRRFPAATDVAARILTLPTHPLVSAADRRGIVECLAAGGAPEPPVGAIGAVRP